MKKQLQKLLSRNKILKPIVFVGFNTEKELMAHRNKISKERDEYYNNLEKIQQLEWELMSPEEQERQKKIDKFLELKSKGEPFDLSEFEDL